MAPGVVSVENPRDKYIRFMYFAAMDIPVLVNVNVTPLFPTGFFSTVNNHQGDKLCRLTGKSHKFPGGYTRITRHDDVRTIV